MENPNVGAWGSDGKGHGVHIDSYKLGRNQTLDEIIESLGVIMDICKQEAEKAFERGNVARVAQLNITWDTYLSMVDSLKKERQRP